MDCEVAIVGAGVAGLTAAAILSRAGLDVLCLEAGDRIGGRVFTVRDPLAPLPVELGAEFVHGCPDATWEWIRSGNLTVFEHTSRALHLDKGSKVEAAAPDSLASGVMERMTQSRRRHDESFQQYLQRSRNADDVKDWARIFVEGFNAARSDRISVQSLAAEGKAADKIQGDRAFRILNGYDAIPGLILQSMPEHQSRVFLNTVVERVAWRREAVALACRSAVDGRVSVVRSRRLVVTVPLGVLHANAIGFEPEPRAILEAARRIEFGQVYRITFRFARPFWDEDVGFMISKDKHFFAWWTTHPIVSPVLTAWMAGSAAESFEGSRPDDCVRAAMESLRRILRRRIPAPEAAYFHNWRADPFFRGAYSYVPAGQWKARAALARPQADTLFFAGEAANVKGHAATVHGAMESGRRAAELILK